MAIAALVGYGLLLIGTFGIRTVVHRRRTGSSGWLAPPTTAAWFGDGLFTVGLIAVIAAPVLDLVHAGGHVDALDRMAVNVTGLVLLGGGAALALLAQAQMGSAWRAGIDVSNPYHLATHGVFGIVRNPFYTGMLTASAGVALMVPNLASLAGGVALLIGCEIDVRMIEEPHLRGAHGAAYAAYERSTPRFVPAMTARAVRGGAGRGWRRR